MAWYGDQWMAFVNTVWGPVDGFCEHDVRPVDGFCEHGMGTSGMAFVNTVWRLVDGFNEHGVETSGWLLWIRCKDQWKGLKNTV